MNQPNYNGYNQRHTAKFRIMPLILIVVLCAAAIGLVFIIKAARNESQRKAEAAALAAEVAPYRSVFLPNIYVDGINVGGMDPQTAIDRIVDAINKRQNSWSLALNYQGHTFITLNFDILGITTSIEEAYSLLEQGWNIGRTGTNAEIKQKVNEMKQNPVYFYTGQSNLDESRIDSILAQIEPYFYVAPVDAEFVYFSPDSWNDPFGIQHESYGMHMDTPEVKRQILQMLSNGTSGNLEIKPVQDAPKITEAQIRSQLTLRAEAITPVSNASTAARTDNIRTALSKYNGKILKDGEKCSFNTTVGPRTTENGFQIAIEYVNGFEEYGVGGGVCQASTTVYLAALKAGLEIVTRTSHSDEVSYTTFGQDATVYYSRDNKIDFVFRNNSGGTIYITARVETVSKNKYQSVVRIYGPSLGDGITYKLRSEKVEILPAPYEEEIVKDKNHTYVTYTDEEYVYRKARDGYITETYLECYQNGVLISQKKVSRDTCKARSKVIYVGTKQR